MLKNNSLQKRRRFMKSVMLGSIGFLLSPTINKQLNKQEGEYLLINGWIIPISQFKTIKRS